VRGLRLSRDRDADPSVCVVCQGMIFVGDCKGWAWGVKACWTVSACGACVSKVATCLMLSVTASGVDRDGRCLRLHFVWAGHLLDGLRCDKLGYADAVEA
jgi:hypothetical protein